MAVGPDVDRLERDVPRDAPIVLDTSAAIAYLNGSERASAAATWLFDGCVATGRNPAVISAVSVAELMVGPSKAGAAAIATMEGFFRFFDAMRVVPFDLGLARSAARIRASTGLALPDAAVVATAIEHESGIVITNDKRWSVAVRGSSIPVSVCLLADYA